MSSFQRMVKKLFLILLIAFFSVYSNGCSSIVRSSLSWLALNKGERLAQRRLYNESEVMLSKAVKYHPENSDAWIVRGDGYLTTLQYEKAISAYKEALKYDKNAYKAVAGVWAVELEERGYTEEAKADVKKEIEDHINTGEKTPERLMAGYMGLNYLHEYDNAEKLALEIVKLRPDKEVAETIAGNLFEELLREKDPKKRLELAEDFISIFPDQREQIYLTNLIRLRTVAKELNDTDLLLKYGEVWLNSDPDNRRANFYVGYYYMESDIALDRAVDYLRKALTLIREPDPADKPEHYPYSEWYKDLKISESVYYDTLGWAYFKLGRYSDADRAYKMAEKYNDVNSNLHYHIGVLMEKEGKTEEALFSYIRALRAGENNNAYQNLRNILETNYSINEPFYKLFAGMDGVTTFTDVTEETGLNGIKVQRVSWGDYNSDGYEDLLFNGYLIYKNYGDGTFKNVTQDAGVAYVTGANGGLWGDFDNDGNPDFYTFASGKDSSDRFWRNNGDGIFSDITQHAIAVPDVYPSEAAAWGDYDKDGFIDIYVTNYEKPLLSTINRAMGTPDRLYHNNGDNTFSEISAASKIAPLENMAGRGVTWGDYDNDGDSDIYVSNYRLDPNFLWKNNGNNTFTNIAEEAGVEGYEQEGAYGHSIGAEWGDYNNDGNLDLFASNLAHPRYIGYSDKSMLLENQGPPDYKFKDRFGSSGIRFEETTADPSFADYDNDGVLDLFFTSTYEGKKSFLYKGNGDGTFTDITWLAGVRVDNGWGNAFADYDNDGDLDLIVASSSGNGVRLFRNDGNSNHYLQVKVVGSKSNRSGIGARVSVMWNAENGKETHKQIREVQGGKGSGSQHSMIASFGFGGFGSYDGVVDVEVRFPSGKVIHKSDVRIDQRILVTE